METANSKIESKFTRFLGEKKNSLDRQRMEKIGRYGRLVTIRPFNGLTGR